MGIDTLGTMMQWSLRLIYEMYESVTILLYQSRPFATLAMISVTSLTTTFDNALFPAKR